MITLIYYIMYAESKKTGSLPIKLLPIKESLDRNEPVNLF